MGNKVSTELYPVYWKLIELDLRNYKNLLRGPGIGIRTMETKVYYRWSERANVEEPYVLSPDEYKIFRKNWTKLFKPLPEMFLEEWYLACWSQL